MLRTVLAVLVGGCLLAACGSEQTAEEEPLRLPEREETWVKSEKVETTRDEVAASQQKTKIDIPIDQDLREKLMEASGPAPATPVTDAASCRAMLDPLNQSRMALQKHGGAWHAFERSPLAKPFSNNGMQLDSNLNKLVFSLRYLCRTAQGVPLNSLAKRVGAIMDEKGKENAREHFIEVVGEAPKDVDDWINYTEFARKNQTRKVPYADIQKLIQQTQPLMDLYKDLLDRKVEESNLQKFLSDTVTLLSVINDRLAKEPHIVMARTEETTIPLQTRNEM